MPDGIYLQYYENGKLSDSVTFINGKKNGIERTYFESGSKKSSFYYRDGVLDSFGYLLHPNGKIAEWYYRKEGALLGIQFKLDTLEKPIYMLFSTPLDSLAFEIYFSSNSTIEKMVGVPLYVLEEEHNINVNDTFRTINLVPQFGRIRTKLQIIIMDASAVLVNERIAKFEKLWNAYGYFFEYKFKKPGKYSYIGIVELYDSTNLETLKIDTVKSIVNIRG